MRSRHRRFWFGFLSTVASGVVIAIIVGEGRFSSLGRDQVTPDPPKVEENSRPSVSTSEASVAPIPLVTDLSAEEQQARSEVLFKFQVSPEDASVYLDSKFIGAVKDLSEGAWVPRGRHVVALISPGYESQEHKIIIDQAGMALQASLVPEKENGASTMPPENAQQDRIAQGSESSTVNPRIESPNVHIIYSGLREEDASEVMKRLSNMGVSVSMAEEAPGDSGEYSWNRLVYSKCHQKVAQAIKETAKDVVRITLMRSADHCGPNMILYLVS